MRWLAITLLLGACGRLDFDALADVDAARDVASQDADGDAQAVTPIVFLQQASAQVSSGTKNLATYPQPVAQGDLLVVAVDVNNHTSLLSALTDTLGNTYVVEPQIDSASYRLYVAYAISVAAGTNVVTATLSATATNFEMRIHAYSGAAAAPFDAASTGAGTTTGVEIVKTGSLTTTVPGDLVFAAVNYSGGGAGDVAGVGFTSRNTFFGDVVEDRIVDTARPIIATASADPAATSWAISAIAFRPR